MKVFGIGWAKTGTTTLGRCLEILGYRHQGQRLDLVADLAAGDLSRILTLADAADAFEDWPWILLYRELDAAFPGSRFILTRREPGRWLRSYLGMLAQPGIVTDELTRIRRVLYGLPFPDVTPGQLVDRFRRHNDEIADYFRDRPGDLLVVDWERGDGWPQLCRFLDRPIPSVPFPHENPGRHADAPGAADRDRASAVRFPPLIEGVVAPLVAGDETVALVGFPHHWNIGDSVIWAGALETLRSLGVRVGYACTPHAYDPAELRRHVPDGPVLITGGGNFGDVYLDEVALRRRVLEDFPDRRVIQLPQSIWLRTREGREELQRLVDAHPAFTLLVRERRSLDVARSLFQAPCLLCPDLALALEGRLPAAEAATRDVTGLVRGDIESLGGSASATGAGFADWPREEPPWRDGWSDAGQRAWDAVTAWHGRRDDAGGRPSMHAALEAYETLARERTHAGATLLCSGRVVVSDRLHAALVAWLAGRQAVLVDSVSGKSRSTLETWFTGVAGMHAASDWGAGLDLAARLGAAAPPA